MSLMTKKYRKQAAEEYNRWNHQIDQEASVQVWR